MPFLPFVYGYPSSCPRAHCTPNKSVPTLRYTRRHRPVHTGPCPKALTECSPLDFRRSSIVSDGQKGGRAWTIPEHSGWYGGGGGMRGRGEECSSDNEGMQWTSQPASGERTAQAAATEQAVTCLLKRKKRKKKKKSRFINPFTAPVCTTSGLKDARTR